MPWGVKDSQASVPEVDVCGGRNHGADRSAVVIGPHPVTEFGVRVDLMSVPELAVPFVDHPLDRVHEWPVELVRHGERSWRERAGGGEAARVIDICVRDEDMRDVDLESGILTVTCPDRSRVIVNRQTPNREIWIAARSGGFHFALRDGRWIDTRAGEELFASLARIVALQAGVQVAFE